MTIVTRLRFYDLHVNFAQLIHSLFFSRKHYHRNMTHDAPNEPKMVYAMLRKS